MDIFNMFDLEKKTEDYLDENSSWTTISHYFMFLTLKNGGCSKSSSGTLQVVFPTHFTDNEPVRAELQGYDMPNMNRHEYFEASNEIELKKLIITKLASERIAVTKKTEEDIFSN